jgi:hypothetical protein
MKIFQKKIWFEAKARLCRMYNILTEKDFNYKPGKECEVPEKIRNILGMTTNDFNKISSLKDKKDII